MPRLPSSVRRRTREFFVPGVGFRLSAQRFPRYVTTGILIITLLVLTGSLPGFRNDARATSLSPGFVLETVVSGLDNPTAVAASRDGRTFIVERDGLVKVFSGPDTTVSTYIDLRAAANETSTAFGNPVGITLHPQFPAVPLLFITLEGMQSSSCEPGAQCAVHGTVLQITDHDGVGTEPRALLDGWCSPRTEHGMGDIAFGPDQQLYISAGDGAQLEGANSVGDGCGDPIGDPSALRAQDIRSPGDPTTLSGVVVRIDPSTGLASSGNPISGDENADRIIAVGLHNPTQIEFRPGTQQLWVGDDHPGSTSELNIVSVGDGLPNFGWPCREGDASVPEYAGAESCQNLTELEVTSPFATFRRAAHSGNNTACSVAPDSSTGGLAFYPGGSYPSRYHGALFMADAERGCVWSVFPDGNGNPDFSTSEEFLSGVSGVGSLSSGPDGDLLFLDGKEGTLHRVRYQADIVAPASVASLYVPASPLPTTVLSPPTSAAIVAVAPAPEITVPAQAEPTTSVPGGDTSTTVPSPPLPPESSVSTLPGPTMARSDPLPVAPTTTGTAGVPSTTLKATPLDASTTAPVTIRAVTTVKPTTTLAPTITVSALITKPPTATTSIAVATTTTTTITLPTTTALSPTAVKSVTTFPSTTVGPATTAKATTSAPVTTIPKAAVPSTTVAPVTTVPTTTVAPAMTLPVFSGLVVNVRTEGAAGNGGTDDTDAIQRASDKVRRAGGGTVLFPAGTYLISNTVHIYPGVTYEGTGNPVIQAKAGYPKDTRMFTTESFPWVGTTDSPYLIVRGLTFDGNSSRQGAYKNYENEHSFLLYLTGNPTQPGRLRALVENTTVRNGVADGISVFVNADVQIRNVRGDNLFRGAVTMTGGYSKLDVNGLTTTGDIDRTGIDIETDGNGYGGTLRNESTWRNLDLDGDLDFQVYDGSTVTADNIHMRSGPIFIGAMNSTITINNSTLAIGMADSYLNRIVAPHNVTFNNTTFTMTQQGSGPFYGIDIYWQLFPTQTKQQVTCNTCTFTTDNTINNTTPAYGFYNRTQATTDTLTLNNTTFTPRFTKPTNSS